MKTYKATIYASYEMDVEVLADSPEQARKLMMEMWNPVEADNEYFEVHDLTETEEI